MKETLGQKQKRFAKSVARLIDKAHELGFEVTLGDAFRDPRVFGSPGVTKSVATSKSLSPAKAKRPVKTKAKQTPKENPLF